MNRSILILLPLLISGIFVFNSCEKELVEKLPTKPDVIPEKVFTADVDGIEFIDTILWAIEDESDETITITATADGGYPKMIFQLPSTVTPGTYELGGAQSTNQALLQFGALPAEKFQAMSGTGSMIITKHDQEADFMKATFYFTAGAAAGNTSTFEFDVTNGDFTISY